MNVVTLCSLVFTVFVVKNGFVNGLVCHCTEGFSDTCVKFENGSTLQNCSGFCAVGTFSSDPSSVAVVHLCSSTAISVAACSQFGEMAGGSAVCCLDSYCNTLELYEQFLANITISSSNSSVFQSTMTVTAVTSNTVIPTSVVGIVDNFSSVTPVVNGTGLQSNSTNSPIPPYAVALIVILSLIILVVIVVTVIILSMYFLSYYRNGKQPTIKDTPWSGSIDAITSVDITVGGSSCDWSAGSDSGLPVLVQLHIARQITREHLIGRGRYGQVWKGYYKGEDVAVKVFQSIEEMSWLHEVDIYNKCALRHPNILRFIAADRSDAGMNIENWLIAEFCDNGNLYDYLQCYVLPENTMVEMAHDIASGLVFIHSEITGTEGKAPIAHRDLKSRNILVKKDLSLCISDFGLAVRHDISSDKVEETPTQRVGTRRYLAPEILDGTMSVIIFDSFKRADIYSFGLVLWEIVRRGQCNGVVEEPQLPYYDCVPCDPSFEEMQSVVCVQQRRPLIPNRWHQSPVFSAMAKLLSECWHYNGEARLKALRVRRRLEDTLRMNADKSDSPKSTAKP